MRILGIGMGALGSAMFLLASFANLAVGIYALFHYFGTLAFIGILFFPITIGVYPFIIWGLEGETIYLVIWGSLWGVFILASAISSIGENLSGTKE